LVGLHLPHFAPHTVDFTVWFTVTFYVTHLRFVGYVLRLRLITVGFTVGWLHTTHGTRFTLRGWLRYGFTVGWLRCSFTYRIALRFTLLLRYVHTILHTHTVVTHTHVWLRSTHVRYGCVTYGYVYSLRLLRFGYTRLLGWLFVTVILRLITVTGTLLRLPRFYVHHTFARLRFCGYVRFTRIPGLHTRLLLHRSEPGWLILHAFLHCRYTHRGWLHSCGWLLRGLRLVTPAVTFGSPAFVPVTVTLDYVRYVYPFAVGWLPFTFYTRLRLRGYVWLRLVGSTYRLFTHHILPAVTRITTVTRLYHYPTVHARFPTCRYTHFTFARLRTF